MSNRNYTPFLDMNLLVSDDLIQALHSVQFALIGLLFATMLFGYLMFSLVVHLFSYLVRSRYKKRPYIEAT